MPGSIVHHRAGNWSKASRYIRLVAGYLLAGICLFWILHNIHFREFFGAMASIRWRFIVPCVLLEFLTYFCVAWEWQLLLRPMGTLSLRQAFQGVLAGRFANDALPLQLGYIVRATLAAQWMNVKIISVFPSLIMERLWDGVWVAAGIGLMAMVLPVPPAVLRAAGIFGGIVLAGTVATVFLVLGRHRIGMRRPFPRIGRVIQHLSNGMNGITRSGLFVPVLGLSLLKLGVQAAAFLVLLSAYNIQLPIWVGLAVFLAGYLGICIPSTPAGTGLFQVFVVAGLTLFGISKSIAAGFAIVAFVVITVPLAVAGFFSLAQSGLHLRQIRARAGKANLSD